MTSLFIATPCYGGNVHVYYMESVIQLISLCNKYKIKTQFFKIPFESLIPRARNVSACAFLKSGFTHMIFIDADIEFNAEDVIQMILSNKELIGGTYPTKCLNPKLLSKATGEENEYRNIISKSVNYTSQGLKTEIINGIVECDYIATGFMVIKREVFLQILEKYKDEIKYNNDIQPYRSYEYEGYFYDFFQSKVINDKYVSEDYGFCQLWKNCGGTICTYMKAKLNHIGNMVFYGNPLKKYTVN